MSLAYITTNTSPIEDLSVLDSATIVNEAKYMFELIEPTWKSGKKHKFVTSSDLPITVPTYHNTKLGSEPWYARSFDFTEYGDPLKEHYHQLLLKYIIGSLSDLTQTHTEFEKNYVHELTHYELTPFELPGSVEGTHLTYLAQLYYKFPFPVKKRVFYELVHIYKPSDNEAYVISLNVHQKNFERPGLDADFTTGRYTSIEKIAYNPETKDLKWTMATCSNAGGSIPGWMSRMKMGGVIAKDVPSFLDWADSLEFKKVGVDEIAPTHDSITAAPTSTSVLPPTSAGAVPGPATTSEVDSSPSSDLPLSVPVTTTSIEAPHTTGAVKPVPAYSEDAPTSTELKF